MRESTVVSEWKNEGKVEGQAGAILDFLASRFPPGASPELARLIRAAKDSTTLRQWTKAAATSPSLEEFRRLVQSQ